MLILHRFDVAASFWFRILLLKVAGKCMIVMTSVPYNYRIDLSKSALYIYEVEN